MNKIEELLANPISINMSRGIPSIATLNLSNPLLDTISSTSSFKSSEGIEIRNYGGFDGLKECKRLFADILNTDESHIYIGGNSSLNLMFDLISKSFTHGVMGEVPFSKLEKVKWLCIVPGYDRHFAILEYFNIEMINIPFKGNDPDMDLIEEYIKDPLVKGIWCVPQYSNPTGQTYSNECINRFARLNPSAKDFRIYWDNAYSVHFLYDYEEIPDILSLCDKYGHPDLVYEFTSTSKITFAGSGVAAIATSKNNLLDIKNHFSRQTIGHDKINQLRHAYFFPNKEALIRHMEKHAQILRKNFEYIENIFKKELTGLASWSTPKGGYFISLYVKNKAKEVIELAKRCGVILTDVGCAYPYHLDPDNSLIRIAPTSLNYEDLKQAISVVVECVKYLSK